MTTHGPLPRFSAAALALLLGASLPTHAAILAADDFSYADGNLAGRRGAGGGWGGRLGVSAGGVGWVGAAGPIFSGRTFEFAGTVFTADTRPFWR